MGKSPAIIVLLVLLLMALPEPEALAAVDTLRGTADIADAMLIGYTNCVGEISDEDCRRFNTGGASWLSSGTVGIGQESRTVIALPGWNGIVPDSARLELYCFREGDTVDRRVMAYPLTTPFIEGTELDYGVGNYPDPDSGVTWYHAYLDVGDGDSLNWSTAGGDYTTVVACTAIVADTSGWVVFSHFERLLALWDSTGMAYGCILINENAFPVNSTQKSFYSSESATGLGPRVVLYRSDGLRGSMRRRQAAAMLNHE
jgi:hypothetical protein